MQLLILNLEAPLVSFGSVAVDHTRPTDHFPHLSMLSGLLGNALGYARTDVLELQRLQKRITYAVRLDRPTANRRTLVDFQTAQLNSTDRAWTTRGVPATRAGDPGKYNYPYISRQHYLMDTKTSIALRLNPANEYPTMTDLADALKRPQRPLFIGKKACPPAAPIYVDQVEAASPLQALLELPLQHQTENFETAPIAVIWCPDDNPGQPDPDLGPVQNIFVDDQLNFATRYYSGNRHLLQAQVPRDRFPQQTRAETELIF